MKQTLSLLFSLFILALVVSLLVTPSQAQCTPRSDWAIYSVVRGDTLASIGRRFKATTAELLAANCLSNPNRIFVGQSLRVPGTLPPITTPAPQATLIPPIITGSVQEYERGLMLWRDDTGQIFVLIFGGQAILYTLSDYARLPDNPVRDVPPGGFVKPILGFGKVWGNFPAARTALGWATRYEQTYTMNIVGVNYPILIPLPGTRSVRTVKLTSATTWEYLENGTPITPVPPPTLDPRVPVTYQPFEKGFMLWRSDTNQILVFYGQASGVVSEYPANLYGNLPDNPIRDTPPLGRFKPVYGFGKVWGNYSDVRANLGWATESESSYRMVYIPKERGFTLTLPDGRGVSSYDIGWQVVSPSPTPTP